MLNYIAAQITDSCTEGPLIDPAELTSALARPRTVRCPGPHGGPPDPGERLHPADHRSCDGRPGFILLWRTTAGFRLRASGAEPKAARYAGIRVEWSLVAAMLISGGFAGLAGAVELTGVHRRAIEAISSGYGFSGIVVALFGGLHPAFIVPAAVFFGLLLIGADMTQRAMSVPANMVYVHQGAIILSIVSAKSYLNDPNARDRAYRRYAALKARLTGGVKADAGAEDKETER
jgi:simple sugar transport system permease protein